MHVRCHPTRGHKGGQFRVSASLFIEEFLGPANPTMNGGARTTFLVPLRTFIGWDPDALNIPARTAVAKAGMLRWDHLPAQAPGQESPVMLQPGQRLTELEEAYIRLTLDHVRGNRKRAAEMLGISLRTLQNRIALLRKEEKAATRTPD